MRRGARLVMSLVLLALLAALGWRGWLWWQSREAGADAAARAQSEQWLALDARLDSLRRDQRAQSQRMAQAEAGARILREEVLGVGQRTALLQDSIDQLAGPARQGAIALRLDEVELLLSQGIQRLRLAGDLDSAIDAYALAAGLLEGIHDPALLDLRQALAQERIAGAGPTFTGAKSGAVRLIERPLLLPKRLVYLGVERLGGLLNGPVAGKGELPCPAICGRC